MLVTNLSDLIKIEKCDSHFFEKNLFENTEQDDGDGDW